MNGGLIGMLIGGSAGVLWGAISGDGAGTIGTGLFGALAGSWIGLVALSTRTSRHERRSQR